MACLSPLLDEARGLAPFREAPPPAIFHTSSSALIFSLYSSWAFLRRRSYSRSFMLLQLYNRMNARSTGQRKKRYATAMKSFYGNHYLRLWCAHLAFAALTAICLRFFTDSILALAFPPFNPPLRPMSARYSDTGERSVSGGSADSPVSKRATSWARRFVSRGSFFGRIMAPLSHA